MTRNILLGLLLVGGLALPAVRPVCAQAPASNFVNFNFDQVEIGYLVNIVGEITGKRFVLPEGLTGKVSVVTPSMVGVDEVYPLFLSILESSGFSVIKKGEVLHIVRLPEGTRLSAPVIGPDDAPAQPGYVTKVIKLKHIGAADLRKVLEPMVRGGKEGAVTAFAPTNHLIITDTTSNIAELEKIILELDKGEAGGIIEVLPLQHASAEDLARQITTALKGAASSASEVSRHLQQVTSGNGALPGDTLIVAAEQVNSLIVVANPPQMADVKQIVAKLDVETAAGSGRLNAIFLNYLSAEEAAKSINALLMKTAPKDQAHRIAIEPSISNNALLVDAVPVDFEYIKELVKSLDKVPQQVLVEVLIAEVSLSKNLDFGVEWSAIDAPRDGTTTVIGRSRPSASDDIMNLVAEGVFPQGLAFGVARGTLQLADGSIVPRIPFLLRALSQNQDVKILSRVPLWAQNNTEATVNVVQNIPVLRSVIEGGAGTSRDVIQNIDRIDVGIKLKFTPQVNPDRDITLKLNPSIEAIISEGPEDTPFTPTIAKREVTTTVTVPDKATVIISGLIREDNIREESRVPILGAIPLLGHLFRSTADRKERTNLLIFVTPHIVTDMESAREKQEQWEVDTGLEDVTEHLRVDAREVDAREGE